MQPHAVVEDLDELERLPPPALSLGADLVRQSHAAREGQVRRFRLEQLPRGEAHIAAAITRGSRIAGGGLSFHAKGVRTHADEERHVHDVEEVFFILQGNAVLELDGREHAIGAGDVIVIEPGENHHIVADPENPTVNLWMRCDDKGNPKQYGPPA